MRATDIDPHVYSVICDAYDTATNGAVAHYPLPIRSPGAQHFAFELLMRLHELGYHVISVTDNPDDDFS